jgi:hypothetical protein
VLLLLLHPSELTSHFSEGVKMTSSFFDLLALYPSVSLEPVTIGLSTLHSHAICLTMACSATVSALHPSVSLSEAIVHRQCWFQNADNLSFDESEAVNSESDIEHETDPDQQYGGSDLAEMFADNECPLECYMYIATQKLR